VENRCISETVTAYSGGNPSSVHTTDYAYDGNQIVLQFDATSAPGAAVSVTANYLSHRYLSGPAVDQVMCDERVTLQNGTLATDEVLWPLADAQGTVRDVAKLTGTTAAVVDHIIYNSFGGVVSQSDPSQGVLFKSTGCFTDPATDIEFHEQRVKIAGSPDWLSPDPINLTSGVTNLNDYCGNDPINETDPSGRMLYWAFWTTPPTVDIVWTDRSGQKHHENNMASVAITLKQIKAQGGMIDTLTIKGHGAMFGSPGINGSLWVEVVNDTPWASYIMDGDIGDVADLLRSVTDSHSQIFLNGCFTSGLAYWIWAILGNGTTVTGYWGPAVNHFGTMGVYGDKVTYPEPPTPPREWKPQGPHKAWLQ
jgi:RHS repeat-associated protein